MQIPPDQWDWIRIIRCYSISKVAIKVLTTYYFINSIWTFNWVLGLKNEILDPEQSENRQLEN